MKHQFITNEKGKKVAVIIPLEKYERMIKKLEMLADIRAYDQVKAVNEPSVPFEKAIKRIESKRKKLKK